MDRTTIIKGSLEICVLCILSKRKSYGYEIMKELKRFNIELKGVGSIYPILTKIKSKNLVNVSRQMTDDGRARVYYELNDKGHEYLERELKEWHKIQQDLLKLFQEFESHHP